MTFAYRVRQALLHRGAGLAEAERRDVESFLAPALRDAFYGLSVRDQRHSYRVFLRLRADEGASMVLLQAALLHDAGKAQAPLGVAGRSLVVIAEALRAGSLLSRLPLLGRRFDAYRRHPQIGARLLRNAGASPELVEIVAEHQSAHPRLHETSMLQSADSGE